MAYHAQPPKKINGPDDMAELVAEVARLDNHVSAAEQTAKASKAKAAEVLAADLLVSIPGKKTKSAEDYRKDLVAMAEKAATENPELVAADGKKSRNYPSGSVGWEKDRDKIVLVDEDKLAKLAKSLGAKIKKALSAIVPWKSKEQATASVMVKAIKVEKDGSFTAELDPTKLVATGTFSRAGYKFQKGEDRFHVWPDKDNVD